MTERTIEAEVLRNTVAELQDQGYEVVIEPRHPILPDFLNQFRPDVLARRNGQNLVIEIVRAPRDRDQRLDQIAAVVRRHPGWDLRVVVINSVPQRGGLTRQPWQALERALNHLIENDFYGAALLIGWSTLEGAARATMPDSFSRAQPAGRLAQMLAQEGYMTPTEADLVRRLAEKRNLFAHGNVDTAVTKEEVQRFEAIIQKLIETVSSH